MMLCDGQTWKQVTQWLSEISYSRLAWPECMRGIQHLLPVWLLNQKSWFQLACPFRCKWHTLVGKDLWHRQIKWFCHLKRKFFKATPRISLTKLTVSNDIKFHELLVDDSGHFSNLLCLFHTFHHISHACENIAVRLSSEDFWRSRGYKLYAIGHYRQTFHRPSPLGCFLMAQGFRTETFLW